MRQGISHSEAIGGYDEEEKMKKNENDEAHHGELGPIGQKRLVRCEVT